MPLDYSNAVELWARERGGHAKLKWLGDPMNVWVVVLEYKVGDPRWKGRDKGENVYLHDWKEAAWWAKNRPDRAKRNHVGRILPGAYAYELDELGVEGIIARLDEGNILSGRGRFKSLEDAKKQVTEQHETSRERARASAKDDAGARARDVRRSLLKIPFLPVGIQLSKEK